MNPRTTRAYQLSSLLCFILLGASVAFAYLKFSQPAPVVAQPLGNQVSAQFQVDRSPEARLLGADTTGGLSPPNVQVLGVMAGGKGAGSAVLTIDGQPSVAVVTGGTITNGWVLAEVNPQDIVIARNGNQHRIALPSRASVEGMINPVR